MPHCIGQQHSRLAKFDVGFINRFIDLVTVNHRHIFFGNLVRYFDLEIGMLKMFCIPVGNGCADDVLRKRACDTRYRYEIVLV